MRERERERERETEIDRDRERQRETGKGLVRRPATGILALIIGTLLPAGGPPSGSAPVTRRRDPRPSRHPGPRPSFGREAGRGTGRR